jgi:hypothetical protein
MVTKKKAKKTKIKKTAKAAKPAKKKNPKKTAAKKAATPKKKLVRKAAAKARPIRTRGKREIAASVEFEPKGLGARSAGQSGDLQGLSNRASADSESVDELLEEGNAFEAGVIKGIQDVPDADEGEIITHEVLEDDVPGEYDDEERLGR